MPEGSAFYNSLDIKDGIHLLEESVLQYIDKDEFYLISCGDLNARTGSEQVSTDDIANYFPSMLHCVTTMYISPHVKMTI